MLQDTQLITVSCRFVPYDRWFVTHIDPAWKAVQVKLWLLSKCLTNANVQNGPLAIAHTAARRRRSPSPITFAPPRENRRIGSESTEELFGYEEDDEDGTEEEGSGDDIGYLSQTRSSRYSGSPTTSVARTKPRLPQVLPPASDPGLAKRYTLIRYATGQFLEDEFGFALYNICPNELLEIHSAELVMTLPRAVLPDYLTPCFHARVSALREVWKNGVNGSSDSKPKLEWRERWVLVRDGVLSLCRGRDDTSSSHDMRLDSLVAIRGADNLEQTMQLPHDHRIICARFSSPEKQKIETPAPSPKQVSYSHSSRPTTADGSSRTKLLRSGSTLRKTHRSLRTASSISKFNPINIAENEDEEEEGENESDMDSILSSPRFAPPPSPQFAPPSAAMRTNFEFDEDYKDSWDNADGGNEADTDSSEEWADHYGEKPDKATKLRYQGKKRRKRRKNHSVRMERDRGQWLVLNMKCDDAHHSLLRILHQHSPETISSSFLDIEELGMLGVSSGGQTTPLSSQQPRRSRHSSVSSLPSSLLTAPRASSPSRSIHSQRRARSSSPVSSNSRLVDGISTIPEANFRPFEPKPYPEWRKDIVHRAQVAGLGSNMGGAMMLILLEKLAAQDSSMYQRLVKDSSRIKPSQDLPGTHSDYPEYLPENTDTEGSDRGESDTEWRGWVSDLQRQIQCRNQEAERRQAALNQGSDAEDVEPQTPYSISVQSYSQRDREGRLLLEPSATVTSTSSISKTPPTASSPSSVDSVHTKGHYLGRKQSASLTPQSTPHSPSMPVESYQKHTRLSSHSMALNQKTSFTSFADSFHHDSANSSIFAGRRPSLPLGLGSDLRRNGSLMGLNIKKRWEDNEQEKEVIRQERHWQKEKKRQEKEAEKERRRVGKGKAKETTPEPDQITYQSTLRKPKPKLSLATSPKDTTISAAEIPLSPSATKPKRAVLRRPGSKQEWLTSESAPVTGISRPPRS